MKIQHIFLFAVMSLVSFFSCKNQEAATTESGSTGNTSTTLVTLTQEQADFLKPQAKDPSLQEMDLVHTLSGQLISSPAGANTITAPIAGIVRNVHLVPGMKVRKNQVLFRIEDPNLIQLQEDFLLTKSALSLAAKDRLRQKSLYSEQSTSEKNVEISQKEWEDLMIKKNALASKLKLIGLDTQKIQANKLTNGLDILASHDGILSSIFVHSGRYAPYGEALVEIIDETTPILRLGALEKDLPYIRIGQRFQATSAVDAGLTVQATISSIVPKFDENGFAEVYARIEPKGKTLAAGSSWRAEIPIEKSKAHVIPEESVVSFEGNTYVFVEKSPLSYEMVQVTLGTKHLGHITLIEPSNLFDQKIVYTGAYGLLMTLKNTGEE